MKYLFLLLIAISSVSCKQKGDPETTAPSKDQATEVDSLEIDDTTETVETPKEWDYYAGTLGEFGDGIIIEITTNDTEVKGGYWYVKQGKKLALNGSINAKSGEWKLTENYDDKITGNFELKPKNDSLVGTWSTPDGKTKESIVLKKVISKSKKNIQPRFENYEMAHQITIYDGENDVPEEATDEMHIGLIGNYVLFNYWVLGTNAHIGQLSGVAQMTSASKALYTDKTGCELSIVFNPNKTITVDEQSCDYYRGMRAYFAGTLKLVIE